MPRRARRCRCRRRPHGHRRAAASGRGRPGGRCTSRPRRSPPSFRPAPRPARRGTRTGLRSQGVDHRVVPLESRSSRVTSPPRSTLPNQRKRSCAAICSNVSDTDLILGWSGATPDRTSPTASEAAQGRPPVRRARRRRAGRRQRRSWTGRTRSGRRATGRSPLEPNAAPWGRCPHPARRRSRNRGRGRGPLGVGQVDAAGPPAVNVSRLPAMASGLPRTSNGTVALESPWITNVGTVTAPRPASCSCPSGGLVDEPRAHRETGPLRWTSTWSSRVRQPGVICPPTGRLPCPLSLCAAIVDRLTFGGNIIETGTSSYRLAHARAQRPPGGDKSSGHPGGNSG